MPVCVQEKRARRVNSARLFILLDFDCDGVSHDAGSNMLARERMQVGLVKSETFSDEWHVRVYSHAANACHRIATW